MSLLTAACFAIRWHWARSDVEIKNKQQKQKNYFPGQFYQNRSVITAASSLPDVPVPTRHSLQPVHLLYGWIGLWRVHGRHLQVWRSCHSTRCARNEETDTLFSLQLIKNIHIKSISKLTSPRPGIKIKFRFYSEVYSQALTLWCLCSFCSLSCQHCTGLKVWFYT